MSVQVKGSGTIGGLDEGLNIVGVVTATSFDGNITGTVGVGTDNPQSVLHVANANTTVWPFAESVSAGPSYTPYPHELVIDNDVSNVTGSFAGIYFNAGGYATTSVVSRVSTARIAAIDTGDYKADLAFSTRGFNNSNHKEHLRIESGGNIGIGTINPATKLHVITDQSSSTPLTLERTFDNNVSVQYKSPSLTMFAGIAGQGLGWGVGTATDLGLVSNNKLMVKPDGKIGIGNTNPERTIDVKGSNCMIQLEGTGGSGKQWSLCSADNTTGAAVGSAGMFAIYNDTDGVAALRVTNSNYVLRPKLPYFYAYATPTAATAHIHSFGNVNQSSDNPYNNSNGRFTAPVSGFYWFTAGLWCNSNDNTTSVLIQLRKYINSNGSLVSFAGCNHTTKYNNLTASGGVYMEQNDYVYIQHQGGMTIQSSTPRNYFSGYLVG